MKFGVVFLLVCLFLLGVSLSASCPDNVHCPEHGYASCYNTGRVKSAADGHLLHLYHCTCGDEWWVRCD
jgi:hypothetical protein